MSNPNDIFAAPDNPEVSTSEKKPLTFAEQVNEVAKTLTQDESGVWQKPEDTDIDANVLFAATLEARRRNTESLYGKTKHALDIETGRTKKLEQRIAAQVKISTTPEKAEELADLQQSDPEAWRLEMNKLEAAAKASLNSEFDTDRAEVTEAAERARLEELITAHNAAHPDAQVTDETLQNDIPPRIVKKLQEGKISFEDFLVEASNYLATPKKVGGASKPSDVTNINNVGGTDVPTPQAVAGDFETTYKNATF